MCHGFQFKLQGQMLESVHETDQFYCRYPWVYKDMHCVCVMYGRLSLIYQEIVILATTLLFFQAVLKKVTNNNGAEIL